MQHPQLEQIKLIKAPILVAKTLADDPGEQLPTGWKALSKYKLFISGTLERDVITNQRKRGSALSFRGVGRIFMKYWKSEGIANRGS